MHVDWPATKEKFNQMGCQAKIARGLGVSPTIVCQILAGTYRFMDSPRAKSVITKLDELGVLVLIEEKGKIGHRAAA
jgi:hypothetical protein